MDRKDARELMERLNRDAEYLSRYFGLQYRILQAERGNVRRRFGVCYSDGTIKIRLFHATTGRSLRYSSLIDTLCHELAHLRYFNHGERFQVFYRRILERARREGIYRPARPRSQPPVALPGPGEPHLRPPVQAPARPSRSPAGGETGAPIPGRTPGVPGRSASPSQLTLF